MNYCQLNHIDPEDIEDLLAKVEKSFNIKFGRNELVELLTFGELCDHIANKIELEHLEDCTSQQAFYKLRFAISSTINISDVTPDKLLEEVFPRKNRIYIVRQVENKLDLKLSFLRPKYIFSTILIIILLISLVLFFITWEVGLSGFVFSIFLFHVASKFGKELEVQTVGELTNKMTRENYLNSRRNPKSFNKKEIENVLSEWFCEDLNLDKTTLSRESKFL